MKMTSNTNTINTLYLHIQIHDTFQQPREGTVFQHCDSKDQAATFSSAHLIVSCSLLGT